MRYFFSNVSEELKKQVWLLGEKIENMDSSIWRKDICGHKIKFEDPENSLKVEFSIYDEKFKELILIEHNRKQHLPFYVTFFLVIIKYLYYIFCILPKDAYNFCKNFLMNICIDGKEADFVVLDLDKK